jgi:hypothetical protein
MKIDFVLTAGNLNHHYLQLFPLVHQVWKKRFNLDCFLVFIGKKETLPDYLNSLINFIYFYEPLENINDIFVAQVIRLLYPVLFPDKTILITDLDILPVKKSYFIDSIQYLHQNTFVTFTDRYKKQEMYAICYNVALGKIYGDLFNFNDNQRNLEGIKEKLKLWYHPEYDGKKNCPGWYTDQKQLFLNFEKYQGYKVVLNDKDIGYNRLNNRAKDKEEIIKNFNKILLEIETFSDIHCIKPFNKTKKILEKMVQKITN